MTTIPAPKRRSLLAIGVNTRELPDHREYIEELREQYDQGLVPIDPDDPRTVRGLTPAEIRYIRGEE